jgi:hypothetical protein
MGRAAGGQAHGSIHPRTITSPGFLAQSAATCKEKYDWRAFYDGARGDVDAAIHVWTAPGWQGISFTSAGLIGAAMCSACQRGSLDRWP